MRVNLILIVVTLLVPTVVPAQKLNGPYPFESQQDYRAKLHVLQSFVNKYGRVSVNRIFVAKANSGNGLMGLYGYWPEGNSILLLDHLITINRSRWRVKNSN